MAHVLLANPQIVKVEIQGHTDNRGSKAFNMQLSQARAESVQDRARNRRVQFRILN